MIGLKWIRILYQLKKERINLVCVYETFEWKKISFLFIIYTFKTFDWRGGGGGKFVFYL